MEKLKHWLVCLAAGIFAVVIYVVSVVLRGRKGDPLSQVRRAEDEHQRKTKDLAEQADKLRQEADALKDQRLPGAMSERQADAELKGKGWLK